MLQTHPDGEAWERESYAYSAPEINQAYAFLTRQRAGGAGVRKDGPRDGEKDRDGGWKSGPDSRDGGPGAGKHAGNAWDAPLNRNAFCEREILHNVEDEDGTVLGNFCVAKGKFLWTVQEDFSLFLRSVYRCCQALLDGIDRDRGREAPPEERQRILAELYYLMAQQFIDATALLEQMAEERTGTGGTPETMRATAGQAETDSCRVFYLPAMLECGAGTPVLPSGEPLYPAGVRRHSLYLRDRMGHNLGYLSFGDDRLYYVVIPLFEQRRVRVRIRAAERTKERLPKAAAGTGAGRCQRLHLWLRMEERQDGGAPESLRLQIERLLEAYGKERA